MAQELRRAPVTQLLFGQESAKPLLRRSAEPFFDAVREGGVGLEFWWVAKNVCEVAKKVAWKKCCSYAKFGEFIVDGCLAEVEVQLY